MSGEIRGSKNLGLIKAIHVGVNPPLNVKILWFDDNIGVKIHKRYNFQTSTWVPLGGDSEVTVNGIYTYIAYASNCEGADFSLTKGVGHDHFAIITSPTLIVSVEAALFVGRWSPYCDGISSGGNYTYIRYATDCNGTDFSSVANTVIACDTCTQVDSFDLISKNNTINATILGNEITFDFTNALLGHHILIELKEGGEILENMLSHFIESTRSGSFGGDIKIQFDQNSPEFRSVNQSSPVNETYYSVINGSRLYIEVNSLTPATTLTGQLVLKIGNKFCDPEVSSECFKCRDYVAFISSDTAILPENITVDLFEGLWINFNSCGDCGQTPSTSQLYEQLNYLFTIFQANAEGQAAINAAVDLLITNLTNLVNDNAIGFQTQIDALTLLVNNNFDDLTNLFSALETTVNNNFDSLTNSIQSALDLSIAHSDSRDDAQDLLLDSLLESVINLQGRVANLEGGAYSQSLTGAIDGVNMLYTTDHVFLGGTTRLYRNGVRQTLGIDYTEQIGNNSILFVTAPLIGDLLTIQYLKDL